MHDGAVSVMLDGQSLGLRQVVAVSRHGARVALDPAARARMERSHAWVRRAADEGILDDQGRSLPIYGVNTGYGSLARVRIGPDEMRNLSWNLIRSHAAGVGPELPEEQVRAMMLLRANALSKGVSGCRPGVVELIADMLNAGVTPVVPSRGSCGSSGDLAPLAHLGLVLFRGADGVPGRAEARYRGVKLTGAEAMARAGLEPLVPGPKEGLAITNGAQLTCAVAALACYDAERLVRTAEIAAALSWEALCGVSGALHADVHALRPFPGAITTAANLRRVLAGSTLVDSDPEKVQDAYSLRCTPQVLGAVRDGLSYASAQVAVELNAVTDNPVILVDADGPNKAFSAGLFHGEPVGFAADHLKLCLTELAAIAERRVYRLTNGALSARLPPSLRAGQQLGMVIPQAVAAALVSACRQAAWPSSADSIPTCEDQEDHVAMSTTAARRASEVLARAEQVVAIELLAATHALRLRREERPGRSPGAGSAAAVARIHRALSALEHDPTPDLEMAACLGAVRDGSIVAEVEAVVGPLGGLSGAADG